MTTAKLDFFDPERLLDRLCSKIVIADSGCWEWTDALTRGYGKFSAGGRASGTFMHWRAHRFAYEFLCEPIPAGLELDHLCRNKKCVNPDHLEPVTTAENIRRAKAAVTHCPRGHEYTEANTKWQNTSRQCRRCGADSARAFRERQKAAGLHRIEGRWVPAQVNVSKQDRRCSVEDCERPYAARGWCHYHYHRAVNYGSPDALTARERKYGTRPNPTEAAS